MNRQDFIRELADRSGKTQVEIDGFLGLLEEGIVNAIRRKNSVKLFTGFTLEAVETSGVGHKDITTGEWVEAVPCIQCKLRTTKKFRERLNAS